MHKSSRIKVIASSIGGNFAVVFGYLFAAIGVIGFVVGIDSGNGNTFAENTIIAAIVIAIGVTNIVLGTKTKKTIERFRHYVSLISVQRMTSLGEIAANTLKTPEFVRNDLQKMINRRLFVNASINITTGEIIIAGLEQYAPPPPEYEAFTCRGCGAPGSKNKSAVYTCSFCGMTRK